MDWLIIEGIKQLHILTSCYSNSMDELAKDLNNALDESSDRRVHDNKVRKSKKWKCRSKSKCGLISSSSVPKSSAKSEDSESSLEKGIHTQMDFSPNGSYQHTDSDDIICKHRYLTSWRHCSTNLGESDSVNENLYPSREPRRKRKFKRMTVDPPSVVEHDLSTLTSVTMFSQKNKRLRNLKSQKISKICLKSSKLSKIKTVSQLYSKMGTAFKDFGNAATSSGKRKRCAHEKSIECNGYDCKEFISGKNRFEGFRFSKPCQHSEFLTSKSQEIHSSGLSSSESECGILTTDESREADDEYSDFYQESGPSSGIPVISPWWENDDLIPDDKQFSHPNFQDILTESFRDMSEVTKKIYTMQDDSFKSGRQIRSGRRRLGKEMIPVACGSDECVSNVPLPNEHLSNTLSIDNCLNKATPNEKKKRKGMTSSFSSQGYGEIPTSVPESNIGFQVLKNMGWKPSTGLGRSGEGIVAPIKALVSDGKQGLGSCRKKDNPVVPHSITHRSSSQTPPPLPSSP